MSKTVGSWEVTSSYTLLKILLSESKDCHEEGGGWFQVVPDAEYKTVVWILTW